MKSRAVARNAGPTASARESRCARCGREFHCGIDDPGGCWCARLPPLPREALTSGSGCLCEACLRALLTAEAPGP